MSITIEDGSGGGYKSKVTSENKLRTYATTEPEISFESETNSRAYSWTNATYDYTAADTVLLVKNTSSSLNLIIESITLGGDTETAVTIHAPTCASPTGTAVTGVNLNRKFSTTPASATAKVNESTNSQGEVIITVQIDGSQSSFVDLNDSVILGVNDCIAVDYVTDGGACYVTIMGYYHAAL